MEWDAFILNVTCYIVCAKYLSRYAVYKNVNVKMILQSYHSRSQDLVRVLCGPRVLELDWPL